MPNFHLHTQVLSHTETGHFTTPRISGREQAMEYPTVYVQVKSMVSRVFSLNSIHFSSAFAEGWVAHRGSFWAGACQVRESVKKVHQKMPMFRGEHDVQPSILMVFIYIYMFFQRNPFEECRWLAYVGPGFPQACRVRRLKRRHPIQQWPSGSNGWGFPNIVSERWCKY